jgi:hypothetical protein
MIQHAADIYGTAFKNGAATLMARVVGPNGGPLVRADLVSASYSVYLLDDEDSDARSAVANHGNVALAVADVIRDSLETAPPWDAAADPLGYNFRHAPDVSMHPALSAAGRRYLVEYRLTPAAGQAVIVRFRINVI